MKLTRRQGRRRESWGKWQSLHYSLMWRVIFSYSLNKKSTISLWSFYMWSVFMSSMNKIGVFKCKPGSARKMGWDSQALCFLWSTSWSEFSPSLPGWLFSLSDSCCKLFSQGLQYFQRWCNAPDSVFSKRGTLPLCVRFDCLGLFWDLLEFPPSSQHIIFHKCPSADLEISQYIFHFHISFKTTKQVL